MASATRDRVWSSTRRRSVLVLAHDPVMRAFIAHALSAHHDIVEAADVAGAVRVLASKETFAVLERAIMDVQAPAALAAMAAMSRSHFSRTFHAVAGISLRDYVRDLRLKRAEELMRASRLSLSSMTQFRLASLSSPSSSAA